MSEPEEIDDERDGAPADAMIALVYDELRALAGGYFRRQPEGHTLQPTALVHEAFVKLARNKDGWRGREHFCAVAATAMRHILTSHARKRTAAKRGGKQVQVTLTDLVLGGTSGSGIDLLELDSVLARLEELSPRQAKVVEYRFFGGLTLEEIAGVLEVSLTTVEKDWRRARAWLAAELSG